MTSDEAKGIELQAIVREIQDRVRSRYPVETGGIALADLMPVVHARDRAEAKVASIGSVNPRPGGPVNTAIQSLKRAISRALNWFVRDQVDFNRSVLDCVQALLEAANENNRAMTALTSRMDAQRGELLAEIHRVEKLIDPVNAKADGLAEEARELKDVRVHWAEWRREWERKLGINEVQFLRSVADLQTAFQHRATLMESNFRDLTASQHRDFETALDRSRIEIQERLWGDLEKARLQFEKLIHNELRVVRQRAAAIGPGATAVSTVSTGANEEPQIDFLRFSDRFRGSEEYVRKQFERYVDRFRGCSEVLDIGCGRGEFLSVLRDAGLLAKGIDSNEEMIGICRSKGLYAEQADLFAYLGECEDASLDGIFCGQVVEHLPAAKLPEMVRLCAAVLRPGGRIVIETPNPECLAIFATHFYLDPTHIRPIPAQLLAFYLEESGFGEISVDYLNPAQEPMPSVKELPADFQKAFFGGLDFSISARRL